MKNLILISLFVFSTTGYASQDKCYETAKKAAYEYAVNEDYVTTMNEFETQFGGENFEFKKNGNTQKEFWSFGDGSMFINVEVLYSRKKCNLKKVYFSQDDQDYPDNQD